MSQTQNAVTVLCEFMHSPVGIDAACPKFTWILNGSQKDDSQKSYRIKVAMSVDHLEEEENLLWDSGVVLSDETISIAYAGTTLETGCVYYFDVEVHTVQGMAYKSEPNRFVTGLLKQQDWKALWIGGAAAEEHTYWYRKEFFVCAPLHSAVALVATANYNLLYVNGEKADDTVLNNTVSDCQKTILYNTYDVTKLLHAGNNAVGLMLGNGWQDLDFGATEIGWGEKSFGFQLFLQYQDGRCETVVSSLEGWYFTVKGPMTFNSIYHGETYDARLEMHGWNRTAYAMTLDWQEVVEREMPTGQLRARMLEPIRIVKTLQPVKTYALEDGSYTLDFGQNFAGWVRLCYRGKSGKCIVMKYAELKHENHAINPSTIRRSKQTNTYITSGIGEELYEPSFTYYGFRYMQVFGLDEAPTQEMFTGCVVRSDVDEIGDFSSSNDILNKLYRNMMWTEASNLHGIPTDCPQRDERLGWLNDMTVRNECALYNYRLVQLYRKWVGDIRDAQGEKTGAITDTAPFIRFGMRPGDPVSASFLLVPWNVYLHYGITEILEENYESHRKWLGYLKRNSNGYIMRYSQMGDWAGPIGNGSTDMSSIGAGAVSVITPTRLIATGYFYYQCKLMSRIAKVLGKKEDADFYQHESDEIKSALLREYYNEATNNFAMGSQASNVFPIYLDLLDDRQKPKVLSRVLDDIVLNNNTHLTTGNLCTRYIIEVLFLNGEEDLAFELLSQTSYPSWGYMIEQGATTIWERWERITEGPLCHMASHNHPMNGAVSVCLHKYLAGIQIDENCPAFKNVIIKPIVPQKLTFVHAQTETIRGLVKSAWEKRENAFHLEVQIPFNCTGDIYLPLLGKSVNQTCIVIDGVAVEGKLSEGYLKVCVGSGAHHICMNFLN